VARKPPPRRRSGEAGLSGRWTGFAATPSARQLTLWLIILQLGGCMLDTMTEQAVALTFFCMASVKDDALELVAGAVWLVLAFSWIVGLLGLRWPALRPAYWSLLAAIPFAWAAQAWLLHRHLLFCDAP
jgi:hypothetical protein